MTAMQTRAIVTYPSGPDAQKATWKMEDVIVDAPGPDELLIEIVATGLCHSDITLAQQLRAPAPPQVLGHEGTYPRPRVLASTPHAPANALPAQAPAASWRRARQPARSSAATQCYARSSRAATAARAAPAAQHTAYRRQR